MNDIPPQTAIGGPTAAPVEPDAHGQAALLLAEAILHALIEHDVLSNEAALGVLRTTCEIKREVAALSHESDGRMQQSLTLLRAISDSLEADRDQSVSPTG